MTCDSSAQKPIRYLTIEPGRISLHGIALTQAEYAVLRGIAERMKRDVCSACEVGVCSAHREVPTC